MKKKDNDLTEILGYAPGPALKKMILKAAADEGVSIIQAAQRYSLPEMLISPTDAELEAYERDHPHRKKIIIH